MHGGMENHAPCVHGGIALNVPPVVFKVSIKNVRMSCREYAIKIAENQNK